MLFEEDFDFTVHDLVTKDKSVVEKSEEEYQRGLLYQLGLQSP